MSIEPYPHENCKRCGKIIPPDDKFCIDCEEIELHPPCQHCSHYDELLKDHYQREKYLKATEAKLAKAIEHIRREAYLHIPEADTQEYWHESWLGSNLSVLSKSESVKDARTMLKELKDD